MLKKLFYVLLFLSHFVVGFILIYFGKIKPEYDGPVGFILSMIVGVIWLTAPYVLGKEEKPEDKIEKWLRRIALFPLIILFVPVVIGAIFFVVYEMIADRMKNKAKPLLKKGFALRKEKIKKDVFFYLTKENVVIKIKEFDVYEISVDSGATFEELKVSNVITVEDREQIQDVIIKFEKCDYRDRDIYDSTRGIVSIINKYF